MKNKPAPADKGTPMTRSDLAYSRLRFGRWMAKGQERAEQHGCFDPFDDCC